MNAGIRIWALALLLLLAVPLLVSQSSSSSTISGTVTDQSGAVVPNATIELREPATNAVRTATTSQSGTYVITNVPPGMYQVSATAAGFKKSVVSSVKAEVGRSHTVNVGLTIGDVSATVEVTATGQELQTLDASVGNVLGAAELSRMPNLNRDATSLLLLQPLATPSFNTAPGTGESNLNGGTVAGARADQNTFMLDGGDATSNTEGAGGYNNNFVATPRAAIPTPVESLEEFRLTTNNPNATFNQSSGAAVQMVTRRGTNAWHGGAYWFLQNDNLNANTWTRNSLGQRNPEMRDNRYGGRIGGPIFKDRTFFFLHYEGRDFLRNEDFTRAVPTQQMRNGILQFRNSSGAVQSVNIATQDPRGIGLNPIIRSIWNNQLPLPNNCASSVGDGLNTCGFTAPVPFIQKEDFAVARFDHRITESWNFMGSFRYGVTSAASTAQVDIGGVTGGAVGVPRATNQRPLQPRYLVLGLTGAFSPNMTNDFRFNYLRHWWQWQPFTPAPQVAGIAAALAIAGESRTAGLVPVNVDTQNARSRVWNGKDFTFQDNVSWVKGTHLIQFGGRYTNQTLFHRRDDKVVGGLAVPVYQVLDGADVTIGWNPTTLGAQAGDAARLRNFYATMLGIVNRGSQLLVRDANFNPLPPGSAIFQNTNVKSWQLYASDTWRITPSFTLTYGLSWSVQMPPFETKGKDTMMVVNGTNEILDFRTFLQRRADAALQGQIYNPEVAFPKISSLGRKYPYDPQYGLFGPRLAIAWNPSVNGGPFGWLMGDRRGVLRAGYSRVFDRVNGVGIVMTPALGIGFGNGVTCRGPRITGGCNPSGNTESTAFRIGVDGSSVPIPTALSAISGDRIIPGFTANGNSPYELLDFRIDPKRKVGVEEMWDLTFQRELPGKAMVEVGYIGRVGYNLPHGVAIGQVPYMFTLNGQTFASAFDAVASSLRANPLAPVPSQPFFQHPLFAGMGGTAGIASALEFEFTEGRVNDIWGVLEGSINPANGTTPSYNQFYDGSWTVSDGRSNYNAGFITLRKGMSRGLTFQMNYTLSKSLDYVGLTQENVFEASDPYLLKRDYGPSLFDRRHIFNGFYRYELPFGKGRAWNIENGFLDRVFGGWSMSGIFTAASGLPYDVINGNSCQEFGQGGVFGNCSAMVSSARGFSSSRRAIGGNQNAFANPTAVLGAIRRPLFSDLRTGRGIVRGQNRWQYDMGFTKGVRITERVNTTFDAQFINLFNNAQLSDPSLDISTPDQFGRIGPAQFNAPRFVQLGLRIDF